MKPHRLRHSFAMGRHSGQRHSLEAARRLRVQERASRIKLNGVAAARRQTPKPASSTINLRNRFSPACAPSAAPLDWANEVGTQTIVDAE